MTKRITRQLPYLNNTLHIQIFIQHLRPEVALHEPQEACHNVIGVKAAKERVDSAVTDAECRPPSMDKWLTTIARNRTEDINLVIDYSNYSASAKPYLVSERLRDELYWPKSRAVKGTAPCARPQQPHVP